MDGYNSMRGCLRFTFLGIPTVILPSAWLVLLILGSSGGRGGDMEITSTLIFVLAGMLSILTHEYGHALVGRALGGGVEGIVIASMGGETRFSRPLTERGRTLLMVLAGPCSALLLATVAGVVLGAYIGSPKDGVVLALLSPLMSLLPKDMGLFSDSFITLSYALATGSLNFTLLTVFFTLSSICVWWSLLNLLPIFPLDGGRILMLICNNTALTLQVSIVTASLLLVVCITKVIIFGGLLCAWFIYQNWQWLKTLRQ